MKHVVAAVDLTPVGRRVADRARLIAEDHDAKLTLVHVFDKTDATLLDAEQLAMVRETANRRAGELAEWVQSRTEATVELQTPVGNPAAHIARMARSADLIVSGTSSLDAGRVGPVTRRLARKARTGVLAVRRQPRRSYNRVLATVDLSETSHAAIELAQMLAPEAEILAAYALVSRFDQMLLDGGLSAPEVERMRANRLDQAADALDAFVERYDNVKPLVVSGPPSMALSEAARRRSADLVTAASKGGGGNSMVLLGTVAEEVLESAHCDVAIANVDAAFRRP